MPRIPIDQIHEDPDFHPPRDNVLIQLIKDVAANRLPLYWAAIPLRYIRPLSPTYKPLSWAPWFDLLAEQKARILVKDYPQMLTYQVGDFFTMSDDYQTYYAYMECDSEFAPCYILGTPKGDHIANVQLIPAEDALRRLRLE